ncbi:MAG TPA: HD domain-containing protein [Candidatus Saccharibacteria bacterium]|nr:HD domain-containing protein [Candidatus Saccharibacteria bacterium]
MDQAKIDAFIAHVREISANPNFIHHKWFVKWHLQLVERIAIELVDFYPEVDKDFMRLLAWLHDYGKILDFDNEKEMTLTAGKQKLLELGFSEETVRHAIDCVEMMDNHLTLDMNEAPIEVRIISSADGCAHMVGPFYDLWWYENPNKNYEELMQDNIIKLKKDWDRKIVIPEARQAFKLRNEYHLEQKGVLPEKFLS